MRCQELTVWPAFSTFIARAPPRLRAKAKTVAIVAIDMALVKDLGILVGDRFKCVRGEGKSEAMPWGGERGGGGGEISSTRTKPMRRQLPRTRSYRRAVTVKIERQGRRGTEVCPRQNQKLACTCSASSSCLSEEGASRSPEE